MTTTYFALIADATASRTLPTPERARVQRALTAALPAWNRRWRANLAARFALTLGDEVQALLTSPAAVWDISNAIRHTAPQVDWVVACGRGPISTPLARIAPEVDGPCFHAARAALESAKEDRRLLAFGGFPPVLNALAAYHSALHWSWTPKQRRSAIEWRAGVSPRRGADPSARSHLRRRMAWPLVAEGDRMLRDLLGAAT
ncbi:MAG TPA: SatD family protein [Gemmatimonadales bacterium]|nr:SatD family protein [Gemmatimonadales bacterium]